MCLSVPWLLYTRFSYQIIIPDHQVLLEEAILKDQQMVGTSLDATMRHPMFLLTRGLVWSGLKLYDA